MPIAWRLLLVSVVCAFLAYASALGQPVSVRTEADRPPLRHNARPSETVLSSTELGLPTRRTQLTVEDFVASGAQRDVVLICRPPEHSALDSTRILLLPLADLESGQAPGPSFNLLRPARTAGFFFLAGVANGVMDTIRSSSLYDDSILTSLPNQDFWDYRLSHDNKYKNGDPAQGPAFIGSTTVLVGLTDGWHAAQTVMLGSFTAGALLYDSSGPRWYHKALDIVLIRAAYGAGFSLMFNHVLPR